ncbi:MAG TPA: primosomal protein N', partial [Polyangiaceae bacterium]|nr:primosomal protein N' [Polyangiaceae bacterium]
RDRARRGARVLCELGRRKVLGVVLDAGERPPDIPVERMKSIVAVVDAEPVLPEELLSFLQALASYYVAPIGGAIELSLPAVERTAAELLKSTQRDLGAVPAKVVGRWLTFVALAPHPPAHAVPRGKAQQVLDALVDGEMLATDLEKAVPGARAAVKRLAELGFVNVEKREPPLDALLGAAVAPDVPPELTAAQADAVAALTAKLEAGERAQFLLEGVTASGKTEVYLRAAKRALELGKSAIVLVPEIALTPQLVGRFRARLGDRIAVMHSGLSDTDRQRMWRGLRSGELRIAVGARSALFAPVSNLGLICVDEEHDGSFKQEEGVRYHARDMALLRAHRAGAVCVLGSATPSLSSVALVREGRLAHLRLPARARATSTLPTVEVVDIRRVGSGIAGEKLLSLPLTRALEDVLAKQQQAILFLNRRGFAPSLICESCGHIAECPHCSVSLTLHRARREQLVCHYCDYTTRVPDRCAKCNASELGEEGAGTERIESLLAERFPSARIARLDRDVAAGLKSEKVLSRMRDGEIDILVGTQMVTKGHDLPNVTLVGVLNADAALSMPDFRAAERSFHLLVQVAGRAGRGEAKGKVLIQTRSPDHPAVAFAASHDVAGFVEQEMVLRQELNYPPFSRLALVRVDAVDEARVKDAVERLARLARKEGQGAEVLGPAPAPLVRLRNRYRYRFLVRSNDRAALRAALLAVARAPADRQVRVAIDVDPVNML